MFQLASRGRRRIALVAVLGLTSFLIAPPTTVDASSHREAPAITRTPQVDGTDFYMFRSYELGRENFVTLVANYTPLQDPYGGPNYFPLDPDARYDIHIDNDGDAVEDLTLRFRFQKSVKNLTLPVGPDGNQVDVPVPVQNLGAIGAGAGGEDFLNTTYSVTLELITGDVLNGTRQPIQTVGGLTQMGMPFANIGNKSIPDYATYANQFIHEIAIPGSAETGKVFVGQRKDPFVVNLGETFDLVNLNPLGAPDAESDDLDDKNVTSFCVELPISFLTGGGPDPVIGGWTSARLPQARILNPAPGTGNPESVLGGPLVPVSRLGSPLVNEVVIGLPDKDRFNRSVPADDAQFLTYVTNPTLPEILEILFPVTAPNAFPRNDLVQIFLTGIPGLTAPDRDPLIPGEMLRLNTAVPVEVPASQSPLGVLGGDLAGFPNGRRPGDDVVDIALRAVMGVLLPESDAPSGQLPFTDGAAIDAQSFTSSFPYLNHPIPGSPSGS